MAVLAEFLWRGWNAAFPEVDVGEDIFVIEDETGILWRVQVKTATAQEQWDGYTAQFNVPLQQLGVLRTPDLVYIFVIRRSVGWGPFIIIDREALWDEHRIHGVGSVSQGNLILRFRMGDAYLACSGRDFLPHRNNWSRWPILPH